MLVFGFKYVKFLGTSSVVHNVLLQIVRYKRVNLRKPRPPHFQAKKVDKALSISIPRPYDTEFPEFLKCRKPLSHVRAIKEVGGKGSTGPSTKNCLASDHFIFVSRKIHMKKS